MQEFNEKSETDKLVVDDLIIQRKQKIDKLRQKGIEVYPNKYDSTCSIAGVIKDEQALTDKELKVCGRIMSMRIMGKASFAHIKDMSGKIQIYIKKDDIGEDNYSVFRLMDIGDFVGIAGKLFHTKTGELTIHTAALTLLSKSLRPLPEKWHGLKDIETRYRQRYVDLIVNENVRNVFMNRSRIIQLIRKYFDDRGFIEVETPMMQPIAGGATAKPFITHHEVLDMDMYLRIAPELYLKRLVVGGFEKVYEINRNFRNEGISTKHNPEFTMLEVYNANTDYVSMMELCEALFSCIAENILKKTEVSSQGKTINLKPPWPRLSFYEILKEKTGRDFSTVNSREEMANIADELGVKYSGTNGEHKILDHIFDSFIQPELINPAFIVDYPAKYSPLAKSKKDNPEIAERFELFINGQELANAYSELNDPVRQREKMEEQVKDRELVAEGGCVDEDYLRALEYGMPPCSGLGIGIDRLVMLFTDAPSIRDVILFPQMKKEAE